MDILAAIQTGKCDKTLRLRKVEKMRRYTPVPMDERRKITEKGAIHEIPPCGEYIKKH